MSNTTNLLLDPEKLRDIEGFVGTMAVACVSLQTMLAFQQKAYREGLLLTEEQEHSKAISIQLMQLAQSYKKLTDSITQRCDIDAESVNEALSTMARATRRKSRAKTT